MGILDGQHCRWCSPDSRIGTFLPVLCAHSINLSLCAQIFLCETYAPEILKQKARAMRQVTGNQNISSVFERPDRTWTSIMWRGISKPIVFLGTELIVQVFALYMAVLYGVLYLCLTSKSVPVIRCIDLTTFGVAAAFVRVYTDLYHQTVGVAGLHYLAIALGSTGTNRGDEFP